ncbi:MAG: pyridoxal-phosphate dependent enzyme [Opitutales bacterium]|nr:pyridoxal-phosphate dependent enzyme [Opitutales bacterium]
MLDETEPLSLLRKLRRETLAARSRVYRAGAATPLEVLHPATGGELLIKREDLSPIKAYKWRGAFNRMAILTEAEKARGVVAASAGNHAQGVALGAKRLGIRARIYMPRSTPGVKQAAVRTHGGEWVEIYLTGDSYDDALQEAKEDSRQSGAVYLHAYDDLEVMAGQATLADEVVTAGQGDIQVAFVQIGGGGMAAGVAAWLKLVYPKIHLVAVEGVGQACYQAALEAGKPVRLPQVDLFCDGTAVRQIGDLPFALLPELIDEHLTVSNEEVCEAIRYAWDHLRCIPEPSGAMGLAGYLQTADRWKNQRALAILCGANIDFGQLGVIAARTGVGSGRRFQWRIRISEEPGSMLRLLEKGFAGQPIYEFLYGKTDQYKAWPVFGFSCPPEEQENMAARLRENGYAFEDASEDPGVQHGLVPYEASLMENPVFLNLEFYERSGALLDFLNQTIRGKANFCFFKYRYSGERVGRALIGLEFPSIAEQEAFLRDLPVQGQGYRHCAPVADTAVQRLLKRK